jgi:chitinase
VPVINTAINDIDLVMVQAYNNWYEQPAGTLAFVKDVYVNWMNKPQKDLCNWCTPIPDFTGVPESKLVIGLIASTSAGNAGYYLPPLIIQ